MSSLDDLLSELEAPVVPKTKTTAAKAVTATRPVVSTGGDDLDSLLADLGSPVAKKTSPASASSTSTQSKHAADDLDSLLSDLGSPAVSKPIPVKATASPVAAKKVATAPPKPAADDLDSLLSDLGSGIGATGARGKGGAGPVVASVAKPAAASPKAPAKSVAAVDDLDALMADLGSPTPVAKPAAAKKVGAYVPAAKPVDDLDALMADLGSPVPKSTSPMVAKQATAAKSTTPVVAKRAAAASDDLDALMADLGSPSPVAKPAAKKIGTAPVAKSTADDLDSLMADLGGPATKVTSAKKTATPVKSSGADELDSLMADLSAGGAKSTSSFKVASHGSSSTHANGGAGGAKSRADELDSLMDSLGGPGSSYGVVSGGGSGSSRPSGKSGNDLDDLMNSLSSPSLNTGAAARPSGGQPGSSSRAPAGSVSRFDDLMTTVTADMSDLSSPHGSKSRGVCYHCRQPIYDECMQALGRTYHPEHFMCGSCNNPLGTGSFFELAGQAHCQRCYSIQFCPKCAHCNQAITDRCVTALDKKWHVHCFVCTQCTSPFQGNFFERDGRPYCDKCFHQVFAPRCRSCNQPVLGDCVNALGAQWHPEHFNCQFCRRAFTGTFFEYEGMPYCEAHYYQKMGSSCAGCQQPISGACVDALSKKWHPEHFVCAFCMNRLEGSSYSEKNAKPYCRPCFGKLFGS
jgi:hypothetical protein